MASVIHDAFMNPIDGESQQECILINSWSQVLPYHFALCTHTGHHSMCCVTSFNV